MPRYSHLEDFYVESYLYENDAMQQNAAQQQQPIPGNDGMQSPGDSDLGDYDLRRSILKLQEWVMYIDHKFPDIVDELGGMSGFLTEMSSKMIEDEMIRNTGGMEGEDDIQEEEPLDNEEEITDDDIDMEVSGQQQNTPQSFQNVNKNNK